MIYRPSFSAHHYRKPHIITVVYLVGAATVAGLLWFFLNRANKRRDALEIKDSDLKIKKDHYDEAGLEDRLRLGDRHPDWRYQL